MENAMAMSYIPCLIPRLFIVSDPLVTASQGAGNAGRASLSLSVSCGV
jgi:hypothetical protein